MSEVTKSGVGQRGQWIAQGFGGYAKTFECSVCGSLLHADEWTQPEKLDVGECPVCGAKMDEEVSE